MKIKTFKIIDIYGEIFEYNCASKEEAVDCFCAENGLDRFGGVLEE